MLNDQFPLYGIIALLTPT